MSIYGKWPILTLWGWRDGADTPELLVAWDQFSVDENWDGFLQACAEALSNNDIEPEKSRQITLLVPGDAVMDAFAPSEIEMEVEA